MTAPAGTAANTPPGGALPGEQAPPTEAEIAHHRLTGRLAQLADDGVDWPCRGDGELWYSDDADERAVAAALCTGCPALAACRRYADTARERHGVWGGRDRTPPRPRSTTRRDDASRNDATHDGTTQPSNDTSNTDDAQNGDTP